MKKLFYCEFMVSLLFIANSAIGQYLQDYCSMWYFGDKAGLNFNYNPPTPLIDGQMYSVEGCMTLSKGPYIFLYKWFTSLEQTTSNNAKWGWFIR